MKLRIAFLALLAIGCGALLLFTAGVPSAAAAAHSYGYKLYCASNDFNVHFCSVNPGGAVDLLRQRSEAACIYGRTWGFDERGIWVDRGCRADFAVTFERRAYNPQFRGRVIYCASNDMGFHGCNVNTYYGVRIVRQRSESPCIYGRTWGYDDHGIWVDRGCRADFAIGGRHSWNRGDDRDEDRDYDRDDRPY
jgi:DUF3011 family protein